MKHVSIRELHQATGAIVRAAAEESTLVTDRGRPVAIIQPVNTANLQGQTLPKLHWQSQARPIITGDSRDAVSSDRDR